MSHNPKLRGIPAELLYRGRPSPAETRRRLKLVRWLAQHQMTGITELDLQAERDRRNTHHQKENTTMPTPSNDHERAIAADAAAASLNATAEKAIRDALTSVGADPDDARYARAAAFVADGAVDLNKITTWAERFRVGPAPRTGARSPAAPASGGPQDFGGGRRGTATSGGRGDGGEQAVRDRYGVTRAEQIEQQDAARHAAALEANGVSR